MATSVNARSIYAEYGRALVIRPNENEDSDALFLKVCEEFENTHIEQDAEGNVHIMAPTSIETSDQNADLTMQLRAWARRDKRGRAFDSNACFLFA